MRRNPILVRGLVLCVLWLTAAGLFHRADAVSPTASVEETVSVPILMYHSILERQNDSIYCLSQDAFRSDLLYLRSHGYTTISVEELAQALREGSPLPEKPVILTLDDGCLNSLTSVLPILEELDMKATVSVVGSYVQASTEAQDPDPSYAYLTWDDIRTLDRSGRVEIGNHTWDMHALEPRKGAMRRPDESPEDYQAALGEDLMRLQTALTERSGVTPTVFAYPYGCVSEGSAEVLQALGFEAALLCEERVNVLTGDPEELYRLGRFNRSSDLTTEEFMARWEG